MKLLGSLVLITLVISLSLPSGFAKAHVQIQSVQFQLNNSNITGNIVIASPTKLTIIVTLNGTGTVSICPEQVVQYSFFSVGTGDNINFKCDTITVNFIATHQMQRLVSISPNQVGDLYIRIHILDAQSSHESEIATSKWFWICEIVHHF